MFVHERDRFAPKSNLPDVRQGGMMELRIGLNVLAAVVSFAFLAAIVLGMLWEVQSGIHRPGVH